MFRKLMEEQLKINEAGGDTMNVFRTPSDRIDLPMEKSHRGIGAVYENPLTEFLRTQAKYSIRLPEAVKLIDAQLGVEKRAPVGIGI